MPQRIRTRTKFFVAALFASGVAAAWPWHKEVLLNVAREKAALERVGQRAHILQERQERQPLSSACLEKEATKISNDVVDRSLRLNKTLLRLILPVFILMLNMLGTLVFLGFGIMDTLRSFAQDEPDPLHDRKDA